MRVSHTATKTRLVLDFSKPVPHYHAFLLSNPERLVIDVAASRFSAKPTRRILQNSLIDDVRVGVKPHGQLRIVFDLLERVSFQAFHLAAKKKTHNRLVIDLVATSHNHRRMSSSLSSPKAVTVATKKLTELPSQSITTVSNRKIVIVIDPGHGGKDPGAIGPYHTVEKQVVLKIARELQTAINRRPGFKALMTRHADYYLSLRNRLRIARRYKADIFIAIHADAFINPYSLGASVYTLSEKGASSEAARWLAEKENYSELAGVSLNNKDDMLRSVLIDLSQTATISDGLEIGSTILQHLSMVTRLHRRHVEQAPFVVLKSPDIPSVLIETGFISNPIEANNLRSPYYQQKIAKAIAQGICNYYINHPPRGTQLANSSVALYHVAKPRKRLH